MEEKPKNKRSFFRRWFSKFIPEKESAQNEPYLVLLSNHKTKLFLSSYGHMECINGREVVFLSDFDRFSLRDGMRIEVEIDGTSFPTVPLGRKTDGFQSEFSFLPRRDRAEYRAVHQNDTQKYEIRLMISVLPDKEIAEFSCAVKGYYHTFSVAISFYPILAEKKYYFPQVYRNGLSRYLPNEDVALFYRLSENEEKENRYFGMTASCGKLTVEQKYTVRSGRANFGERISFYFGEAFGEEETVYLLDRYRKQKQRKQRKRKMGTLLQLQYAASGLSQPADAFERFLLQKIFFAKHIPETFASDFFERYGIYGDNPMVLVRFADIAKESERLSLLLRFFKYHCIRGLRYDLIIFYRDPNPDFHRFLMDKIRKSGCENLRSFACGIFPLDENALSESEKMTFSLFAAADFSLSEPIEGLK